MRSATAIAASATAARKSAAPLRLTGALVAWTRRLSSSGDPRARVGGPRAAPGARCAARGGRARSRRPRSPRVVSGSARQAAAGSRSARPGCSGAACARTRRARSRPDSCSAPTAGDAWQPHRVIGSDRAAPPNQPPARLDRALKTAPQTQRSAAQLLQSFPPLARKPAICRYEAPGDPRFTRRLLCQLSYVGLTVASYRRSAWCRPLSPEIRTGRRAIAGGRQAARVT
jgi:hypothetical protein